uniref:Uncharacterized protein n=1 Tax=Chromera velia CCMP2878 TaxID=1169474 RepID=A0A0G4HNA8_9ALVE|eukprot:Cvel_1183.t1-p1 / transcript=Cvel_1183.t1 / gene=Cvel_1183 / organism=Chromera_velia_CCMP2878 / gene_product=hypothetical protein / transcript_product=hypothetical protein / location=Cvel_scaffold39:84634-95945(-) / protein_length=2464 / sequence_SO=supercontig / SO=protein_coding / is_pseudo=false
MPLAYFPLYVQEEASQIHSRHPREAPLRVFFAHGRQRGTCRLVPTNEGLSQAAVLQKQPDFNPEFTHADIHVSGPLRPYFLDRPILPVSLTVLEEERQAAAQRQGVPPGTGAETEGILSVALGATLRLELLEGPGTLGVDTPAPLDQISRTFCLSPAPSSLPLPKGMLLLQRDGGRERCGSSEFFQVQCFEETPVVELIGEVTTRWHSWGAEDCDDARCSKTARRVIRVVCDVPHRLRVVAHDEVMVSLRASGGREDETEGQRLKPFPLADATARKNMHAPEPLTFIRCGHPVEKFAKVAAAAFDSAGRLMYAFRPHSVAWRMLRDRKGEADTVRLSEADIERTHPFPPYPSKGTASAATERLFQQARERGAVGHGWIFPQADLLGVHVVGDPCKVDDTFRLEAALVWLGTQGGAAGVGYGGGESVRLGGLLRNLKADGPEISEALLKEAEELTDGRVSSAATGGGNLEGWGGKWEQFDSAGAGSSLFLVLRGQLRFVIRPNPEWMVPQKYLRLCFNEHFFLRSVLLGGSGMGPVAQLSARNGTAGVMPSALRVADSEFQIFHFEPTAERRKDPQMPPEFIGSRLFEEGGKRAEGALGVRLDSSGMSALLAAEFFQTFKGGLTDPIDLPLLNDPRWLFYLGDDPHTAAVLSPEKSLDLPWREFFVHAKELPKGPVEVFGEDVYLLGGQRALFTVDWRETQSLDLSVLRVPVDTEDEEGDLSFGGVWGDISPQLVEKDRLYPVQVTAYDGDKVPLASFSLMALVPNLRSGDDSTLKILFEGGKEERERGSLPEPFRRLREKIDASIDADRVAEREGRDRGGEALVYPLPSVLVRGLRVGRTTLTFSKSGSEWGKKLFASVSVEVFRPLEILPSRLVLFPYGHTVELAVRGGPPLTGDSVSSSRTGTARSYRPVWRSSNTTIVELVSERTDRIVTGSEGSATVTLKLFLPQGDNRNLPVAQKQVSVIVAFPHNLRLGIAADSRGRDVPLLQVEPPPEFFKEGGDGALVLEDESEGEKVQERVTYLVQGLSRRLTAQLETLLEDPFTPGHLWIPSGPLHATEKEKEKERKGGPREHARASSHILPGSECRFAWTSSVPSVLAFGDPQSSSSRRAAGTGSGAAVAVNAFECEPVGSEVAGLCASLSGRGLSAVRVVGLAPGTSRIEVVATCSSGGGHIKTFTESVVVVVYPGPSGTLPSFPLPFASGCGVPLVGYALWWPSGCSCRVLRVCPGVVTRFAVSHSGYSSVASLWGISEGSLRVADPLVITQGELKWEDWGEEMREGEGGESIQVRVAGMTSAETEGRTSVKIRSGTKVDELELPEAEFTAVVKEATELQAVPLSRLVSLPSLFGARMPVSGSAPRAPSPSSSSPVAVLRGGGSGGDFFFGSVPVLYPGAFLDVGLVLLDPYGFPIVFPVDSRIESWSSHASVISVGFPSFASRQGGTYSSSGSAIWAEGEVGSQSGEGEGNSALFGDGSGRMRAGILPEGAVPPGSAAVRVVGRSPGCAAVSFSVRLGDKPGRKPRSILWDSIRLCVAAAADYLPSPVVVSPSGVVRLLGSHILPSGSARVDRGRGARDHQEENIDVMLALRLQPTAVAYTTVLKAETPGRWLGGIRRVVEELCKAPEGGSSRLKEWVQIVKSRVEVELRALEREAVRLLKQAAKRDAERGDGFEVTNVEAKFSSLEVASENFSPVGVALLEAETRHRGGGAAAEAEQKSGWHGDRYVCPSVHVSSDASPSPSPSPAGNPSGSSLMSTRRRVFFALGLKLRVQMKVWGDTSESSRVSVDRRRSAIAKTIRAMWAAVGGKEGTPQSGISLLGGHTDWTFGIQPIGLAPPPVRRPSSPDGSAANVSHTSEGDSESSGQILFASSPSVHVCTSPSDSGTSDGLAFAFVKSLPERPREGRARAPGKQSGPYRPSLVRLSESAFPPSSLSGDGLGVGLAGETGASQPDLMPIAVTSVIAEYPRPLSTLDSKESPLTVPQTRSDSLRAYPLSTDPSRGQQAIPLFFFGSSTSSDSAPTGAETAEMGEESVPLHLVAPSPFVEASFDFSCEFEDPEMTAFFRIDTSVVPALIPSPPPSDDRTTTGLGGMLFDTEDDFSSEASFLGASAPPTVRQTVSVPLCVLHPVSSANATEGGRGRRQAPRFASIRVNVSPRRYGARIDGGVGSALSPPSTAGGGSKSKTGGVGVGARHTPYCASDSLNLFVPPGSKSPPSASSSAEQVPALKFPFGTSALFRLDVAVTPEVSLIPGEGGALPEGVVFHPVGSRDAEGQERKEPLLVISRAALGQEVRLRIWTGGNGRELSVEGVGSRLLSWRTSLDPQSPAEAVLGLTWNAWHPSSQDNVNVKLTLGARDKLTEFPSPTAVLDIRLIGNSEADWSEYVNEGDIRNPVARDTYLPAALLYPMVRFSHHIWLFFSLLLLILFIVFICWAGRVLNSAPNAPAPRAPPPSPPGGPPPPNRFQYNIYGQ